MSWPDQSGTGSDCCPPPPGAPADARVFTHCLDASDRIVAVNDHWVHFAQENDAPHLTRPMVLKRKIWEFVTCAETQAIYEMILRRVRATNHSIQVPYRCDAPDRRRFMLMEISPLSGDAVRMSSRITRIETRPAIQWPAPPRDVRPEMIVACGWCKRIEIQIGTWVEIEEATALFGMDSDVRARAITHGICDRCLDDWSAQLRG